MANVLAAVGLGVPALVAALAGPVPFRIVVPLLAAVVLVDTALLLDKTGARPVTLAAAVGAVALPAALSGDATDWGRLPVVVAAMTLLAFLLVLVFGRRRHVVEGLAGTMVAGLVIGLGAAGLLLLHGLPAGVRWVIGYGMLVVAGESASALWKAVQRRGVVGDGDGGDEQAGFVLGAGAMGVLVVGLILGLGLAEPYTPLVTLFAAAVALVALVGGDQLRLALAEDAGLRRRDAEPLRIGDGVLLAAADAVLLGAPVLYVLARAEALS